MAKDEGEIVLPGNQIRIYDDEDLRNISSFADAMAAAEAAGPIEDFGSYGTGFQVADKNTLIGTPMVFLEWRYNSGDFGVFVSIAAVTEDGRKIIINDGSSGICKQLQLVTDERVAKKHPTPCAGLIVRNGLTRSDYTYTDDKGHEIPAETFYLAS